MAGTPPTSKGPVKPATPVKVASVQAGPNKPQATAVAVRQPAFKIKSVERRERYLKLCVYGNYGTGKTYLAGSCSEVEGMRDVLLINAEEGDLTLEAFPTIDEATVKNYTAFARVVDFLKEHVKYRDDPDKEEDLEKLQKYYFGIPEDEEIDRLRHYNTVIVDSLSEIDQFCLNHLLGVKDSTRMDDVPEAAEWGEYKQNLTMMMRNLRTFRALPMNVIFTCAEKFGEDETKKRRYTLDCTGQLAKKAQGVFDMVGYLVSSSVASKPGQPAPSEDEAKTSRRLYVVPSAAGRYDAKHRYVSFKGTYFDNPSISSILEAVGLSSKEGAIVKD